MGHLLQWVLVTVLASASLSLGCPGDRPMKQLICRQTGPLHKSFDPCLCTHLVLHKDLQQISSGEAKKAVIDYKAVNPSLQVLGSWSPEVDLEASQLAKRANSLELDGIYLEASADPSVPSAKDKLLNLVKVLATELDSLRSSKRAFDKYDSQNGRKSQERSQDTGILVQLPSHPQALGKHYDLKKLSKYVDYYVMATDNITDVSENGLAYHPSRLMGIDDVLNADSLIDLVSGLGAPHEKLILSLPSSAYTFTLANPEENMPRSKVTGQPKKITQAQLCSIMEEGGWTVERDEDLTAPYAYRNSSWIAFDDTTSAAIKGKYILLRDLAGAAMDSVQMEDWEDKCNDTQGSVIKTLYETFTKIARKPRAAQLLALQEQIHDAYNIPFSDVQLSPYRIVRVVDRAGSIHVVRREAKTEFACSRQGYFTHPSGCNRFYRCVKFNQYSSEFTVFEYDCPAGLAFDERYEVCVWPGSLPDANACKGSSEIAPVPRSRYACPAVEGYYADPENCRWFFACMDHRRDGSELTAYEFRCPFGLVFNEKNLVCDWPWYVDGCGSGAGLSTFSSGITAADILEGRLRPSFAQIPDVQVSGGRIENVNGGYVLGSSLLPGLRGVQGAGNYRGESSNINAGRLGVNGNLASGNIYGGTGVTGGTYVHDSRGDNGGDYLQDYQGSVNGVHSGGIHSGQGAYVATGGIASGSGGVRYQSGLGAGLTQDQIDNSGSYIHDPTGDHGGDYLHQEGPQGPQGPGSGYVADINRGAAYIGSSTVGLKATPSLGVTVGQGSIDSTGSYIHNSAGDRGGDYIHQDGSGAVYHGDINRGAGYVGLKTTPSLGVTVGQGSIDSTGAYVHDPTGDRGVDYIHQDGPGAVYHGDINRGSAYVGLSTIGLKTTPSVGVSLGHGNIDSSGAYIHDSAGGAGGAFVSGGHGANVVSSTRFGQKTTPSIGIAVGQVGVDGSGNYIHDASGNQGGAYVQTGNIKTVYSGASLLGQKNIPVGSVGLVGQTVDSSGSYIHDTTGDHGGDYIHQEIRDGGYVHEGGKGSLYRGEYGSRTTVGLGINQGQIGIDTSGAYVHDSRGDGGSGYVQTGSSQTVYPGGSLVGQKTVHGIGLSNVDNSGSYIHDNSRVQGGGYVHQQIGGGGYIHDEGNTNIYTGSAVVGNSAGNGINQGQGATSHTRFSSASGSGLNIVGGLQGNDGQYIHDSTGDHGGDYVHQEGPQGPGYVHDNNGAYVAGLYSGHETNQGSYYAGGFGNYKSQYDLGNYNSLYKTGHGGAYVHDNNGAYVHDNSGDYVEQVAGNYVPTSYSPGTYTVGTQDHYAGGYGGYYKQQGVHAPANAFSSTYIKSKQTGSYPGQYVTNVQPVTYEGIGGAAISSIHSSVNGDFGIKSSVPSQSFYQVTTPKPAIYHSTVNLPVSSTGHSVFVNQPTSTVSPITVSSTPIVPFSPVQYATVTQKPLLSYSQVKPGIQTYSVSTASVPVVSHSYKQPVNTFTITGTPTIPVVRVPVTTPLPPVSKISYYNEQVRQNLGPSSVSYSQPQTVVQPVNVVKTPIVPLNPVQYVQPVSLSTPAPAVVSSTYYQPSIRTQDHVSYLNQPLINTYQQPAIINTGYQQTVSSPGPSAASYTFGTRVQPAQVVHTVSEQKPLAVVNKYFNQQPIVSSTVTPIEPVKFVHSVKPIVISTPAPFRVHSESVSIANSPAVPVNQVQYSYPVISSQAPPVVSYSYKSPAFVHNNVDTVVKPLPPKEIFSYSYQQPTKTDYVQPISVSTTPVVPFNPVQYVKPAHNPVSSVDYTYQKPISFVNTYEQRKPIDIAYNSYQHPIVENTFVQQKPNRVNFVTTPAPVFQKINTFEQCTNCVSPSLNIKQEISEVVQPISVSTTPIVPLAPVQYVRPVQNTGGVSSFSYSYKQPEIRPVTTFEEQNEQIYNSYEPSREYLPPLNVAQPVVVSTSAPPVISYTYEKQRPIRPVTTFEDQREDIYRVSKKPYVGKGYLPPVATVVSSTPAPPLVSYSYEQEPLRPIAVAKQTFGSKIVLPPVAPIVSSTPSTPVFSYSYEQKPLVRNEYVQPVAVSSAPYIPLNVNGTVLYGRPVPVKGCTVCSQISSENERPVPNVPSYNQYESGFNTYTYQEKPVVNTQYISQPIKTTNYEFQQGSFVESERKPIVPVYQYQQPAYQVPATKQEYVPAKTCTNCLNSQSAAISVSSTPVVPFNTIQYVSTPTPIFKQTTAAPQLKVVQPVVTDYQYQQPFVVQDHKFIQETYNVPSRPALNYNYQKTVDNVQPITVTTSPIVPLNRVQYVTKTTPFLVSTTPAPVTYTDSHYYELNKVVPNQRPIASVVTNRPVTVTSTSRPSSGASFQIYKQQNIGYSLPKLSSPSPFRTQYTEGFDYTASVAQSPTVGVVKGSPVFEEYFGINKNDLGTVGQINFNSRYEGDLRLPSVTYSTPAPALKTVKYGFETRVPVNEFQYSTTVTPTTPQVRYTATYKQPTTVVSEPISHQVSQVELENYDDNFNAHIDLAKIGIDSREQYFIPTSTFAPSTVGVTVGPTIKRVQVNGGQGYYVRKQKVRVRPVITTTENYPSVFTTSYKPVVYSSTLDLSSPTLYSTTLRPIVTSSLSSAELDIETSDEKLVDEVSGNFGEVINDGNQGIIEQNVGTYSGFSSTTIASLKDGEAIVGVIKKTRVSSDGRKKAKVVVVSRLSDFNPILVGKLGAQCSCQTEGQPENLRRVSVKRVKGRLFSPQTSTADYLASTAQEYVSSSGSTVSPVHNNFVSGIAGSYNYQEPVVEIKPIRKVQRIYSTTTALPFEENYAGSIDGDYAAQIPSRGRNVGQKRILYQSTSETNSFETETKVTSGAVGGDTVDLVRGNIECQRAGLFRHPKRCNKFYSCNWDPWKKKFTLSVFNCPIHLAYDSNLGACNWPSKGPACSDDNLLV